MTLVQAVLLCASVAGLGALSTATAHAQRIYEAHLLCANEDYVYTEIPGVPVRQIGWTISHQDAAREASAYLGIAVGAVILVEDKTGRPSALSMSDGLTEYGSHACEATRVTGLTAPYPRDNASGSVHLVRQTVRMRVEAIRTGASRNAIFVHGPRLTYGGRIIRPEGTPVPPVPAPQRGGAVTPAAPASDNPLQFVGVLNIGECGPPDSSIKLGVRNAHPNRVITATVREQKDGGSSTTNSDTTRQVTLAPGETQFVGCSRRTYYNGLASFTYTVVGARY